MAAQTDAEGEDCVGKSLRDAENDAVDGKKSNVKHGGDAPKTFKPLYRDTKSKNKRRPCGYCNFFGVHLNCHLQYIHGDIVTSKDLQMRLVYRADVKEKRKRGEKTTISNKHEHLYQCGLSDCHKIVSRMAQHLKRYHKIVNPAKIAEAQKQFTRLSGQRTRGPTSTQGAKPKPATKVRRGPKSPKSKKRAADDSSDSDSEIVPPTPKRRRQVEEEEEEESSTDESAYSVADDSDDSLGSPSELDVSEKQNRRWKEFYLDTKRRDKTMRGHFISTFYRYLLHVEGGAHSEEQAMIHTRQVHRILDILDKDGDDLDCLIWKDSLDIWDVFAGPRLQNKELKGETLKVYLRSLE